MYCPQNAVDDVKIINPHLLYHLWQETLPFGREILTSNDTDGITELKDNS